MFSRRLVPLLVLAAVVMAACGDDDDSSGERDQALVERIVLSADDLPEGWEVGEDDDDDDSDIELPEECSDLDAALGDEEFEGQTAQADSDRFVRGDITTSGSQAELFATVASAEDEDSLAASMEPLRDEDLPQCLADGLATTFEDLEEDVEFTDIEVTAPDVVDIGDEGVSFHLTTSFLVEDLEFPVVLDVIVVREGRFGLTAAAIAIGEAPTRDELEGFVEIMVDRAADAA